LLRNQVIPKGSDTEFLDFESEVSIMAQLSGGGGSPLLVRVYGAIDPASPGTQKKITCFDTTTTAAAAATTTTAAAATTTTTKRFVFDDDTSGSYFRDHRWIVMGMLLFALVMCFFVMLLLQNTVMVPLATT
jgi:hypothetical protein